VIARRRPDLTAGVSNPANAPQPADSAGRGRNRPDCASDLGGDLTAVERALVERFVGATIVLQALNTKLALGQEIDLSEHAAVCSSMVRIAAKIGLSRRSRIVSGLIEAEASPPPWSPLRDRLNKEATKHSEIDE
jgi:hypothetical protein